MPSQTPNLDLYKVNGETDGNDTFNVDVVLNDNWDKIDAAVGQIQEDLGNVTVPDASLTQKGITQLSSATDSTSEAMAATPKAVKSAYDRGSAGVTAAATAQSRADSAYSEATAAKQLGVEQKANVVAALNSIGVPASTSESWAQLIPKISAIIRATGNATAADLLAGKSASNASGPFNGSMPNRSAENHHMPGLEATVWAGDRFFIRPPWGFYDGFTWVTAAVPGLTAANLRKDVNVAGLIGTLVTIGPGDHFLFQSRWVSGSSSTSPSPTSAIARPSLEAVYRVSFGLRTDGGATAYGQLYVNDVPRGILRQTNSTVTTTFVEDLSVNANDKIQLYIWSSNRDVNVRGEYLTLYTNLTVLDA